MIITYTMFNMPLALWVIKGFIDEVPKSLDDAAKVDGFSTTATVLKIILPQLGGVDWEYVSSLSTIHILPIVVAAFILQKYLTRGLTFGMRR